MEMRRDVDMGGVMDPASAEKIYRELYRTLSRAIGFQMAKNIVSVGEDGFDKNQPDDSLRTLTESLDSAFGRTTTNIMLTTSVKSCFEGDECNRVLSELKGMKLLKGEGK
ncbi:MAG: hypothetical protein V1934_06395 [Methanobacteriota archaeon]